MNTLLFLGDTLKKLMNTKQILYIGGGSAFGAVAAVLLMKALPSKNDNVADQKAPEDPKVSQVETDQGQESGKSERDAEPRTILGQLAEENPELDLDELKERREEFSDSMKERQMERLTNKMAQWGAALGLDEDQQKQMVEIADQQLSELEEIAVSASQSGDPAAISESAKRAMAIMSGRALEDSMGELLTPEQQEKHEEFGERQNQSRAEGRTLRQLASLQEDLMLTPEQRNDVYGVLYENSVASVQDDSGISSMIESFASQSGMSIDPSLQGVISKIASEGLAGLASGQGMDRESLTEMAESAASESIAKQVEQLRPILSAGQLDLYRSQLESRVGNLMKLGDSGE
tara:strand:+ start:163 stop:1206 length:1044 start_codon:yes stop_codon:yes gene_type:complete